LKTIAVFSQYLSHKFRKIGPWLLWNVKRKSCVADRSVLVQMTFSDLRRREVRGPIFRRNSVIRLVPFDLEQTNSTCDNACGRGIFLGVSHLLIQKEAGPSVLSFGDLTYARTVRHRMSNFSTVTRGDVFI